MTSESSTSNCSNVGHLTGTFPVVEERLVLTKELVLREEVRMTRRDTEKRDTRVVTLQRESVTVRRTSAGQ